MRSRKWAVEHAIVIHKTPDILHQMINQAIPPVDVMLYWTYFRSMYATKRGILNVLPKPREAVVISRTDR